MLTNVSSNMFITGEALSLASGHYILEMGLQLFLSLGLEQTLLKWVILGRFYLLIELS